MPEKTLWQPALAGNSSVLYTVKGDDTGGDMVSTQVAKPEVHAEEVVFPRKTKTANLNIVANDENYALAA